MDSARIPDAVTLRYGPVRGRAQALFDYLFDRQIPFTPERVIADGKGSWVRERADPDATGPFGSLPALLWGEQLVAETLPIASFLNRTLDESSPGETVRRDMFCSAAYLDVIMVLSDLVWLPVHFPGADIEARCSTVLARTFDKLRRIGLALTDDPPFFGGEAPTVADFFVFEAVEEMATLMGPHADLLTGISGELSRHRQRMRERPAMPTGQRPDRFTGCPQEPQVLERLTTLPWDELVAPVRRWQLSEQAVARFRARYAAPGGAEISSDAPRKDEPS